MTACGRLVDGLVGTAGAALHPHLHMHAVSSRMNSRPHTLIRMLAYNKPILNLSGASAW
jgi:hypothetical protein